MATPKEDLKKVNLIYPNARNDRFYLLAPNTLGVIKLHSDDEWRMSKKEYHFVNKNVLDFVKADGFTFYVLKDDPRKLFCKMSYRKPRTQVRSFEQDIVQIKLKFEHLVVVLQTEVHVIPKSEFADKEEIQCDHIFPFENPVGSSQVSIAKNNKDEIVISYLKSGESCKKIIFYLIGKEKEESTTEVDITEGSDELYNFVLNSDTNIAVGLTFDRMCAQMLWYPTIRTDASLHNWTFLTDFETQGGPNLIFSDDSRFILCAKSTDADDPTGVLVFKQKDGDWRSLCQVQLPQEDWPNFRVLGLVANSLGEADGVVVCDLDNAKVAIFQFPDIFCAEISEFAFFEN